MKWYTRVNKENGAANALLRSALELFPKKGYEGTSVRDIARRARTNLGAVTYHFGTKKELYYATIDESSTGYRQALAEAADGRESPLDRIEKVVRANFSYLARHPQFRQLMLQQLVADGPLAPAALINIQSTLSVLIGLITEGQMDRSIRSGDARLLAMTVAGQPLVMSLTRPAMQAAGTVDLDDPHTSARIVENAVRFIRVGLSSKP